jgi:hypothetical protein
MPLWMVLRCYGFCQFFAPAQRYGNTKRAKFDGRMSSESEIRAALSGRSVASDAANANTTVTVKATIG